MKSTVQRRSLTILFCLIAVPGWAQSEWRTEVQVSTGSGVGTQFAFDGGLNISPSYQILTVPPAAAEAEASSELNSNGYIPTLRAHATSASVRAQAVAWGVQAYTNTTGSPISTTLVLQLDANIVGNNDLEARIYLFQNAGFEFYQDPGTMLFESSSQLWPGFEPFANNLGPTGFDIDINGTAGAISETRQFPFTVPAGETFYVWARLVATADTSGEVDAFSTLTASLTNTTGLSPAGGGAPTAVPGPGLVAAIGLLSLLVGLGIRKIV